MFGFIKNIFHKREADISPGKESGVQLPLTGMDTSVSDKKVSESVEPEISYIGRQLTLPEEGKKESVRAWSVSGYGYPVAMREMTSLEAKEYSHGGSMQAVSTPEGPVGKISFVGGKESKGGLTGKGERGAILLHEVAHARSPSEPTSGFGGFVEELRADYIALKRAKNPNVREQLLENIEGHLSQGSRWGYDVVKARKDVEREVGLSPERLSHITGYILTDKGMGRLKQIGSSRDRFNMEERKFLSHFQVFRPSALIERDGEKSDRMEVYVNAGFIKEIPAGEKIWV